MATPDRRVKRVAVLGGESSGKSTLVAALADRYGEPTVAEYGRTLYEERGGVLAYEDLLAIGKKHVADEDAAMTRARRFMLVDTTPLTTLWYSLEGHGRADPELEALSRRPYDVTFLCAPDFPFVADGWRADDDFRLRHDRWLRAVLGERGVPWIDVAGPVAGRVVRAAAVLDPLADEGKPR